jgi:ribonuclease III
MSARTAALQKQLGHTFSQPWLLMQALTHRSFAAEHNERLEFLGDTVLNLAITQCLFDAYPSVSEGDLSRARATLVRQETLHTIALNLTLSQYMRLGDGEIKSGGFGRASMLADMVEALLGAVFLDAGYLAAFGVVSRLYAPLLEGFEPGARQKDAKSLLQETLQAAKLPLPEYRLLTAEGAAHVQTFEMLCVVPAWGVEAVGCGVSRKIAEQEAAQAVLAMKPSGKFKKTKVQKTPLHVIDLQRSTKSATQVTPSNTAPTFSTPKKQLKLKVATEQTP